MSHNYISQQHNTSSLRGQIDMKLTQQRNQRQSSCVMLAIFINGYKPRKSKLKYSRVPLELKQFISKNGLSHSSWSNILWEWSIENQRDFPFSKEEWLDDICQAYNDVTALKRLLQFFHYTKKQRSCKLP